MIRPTHNAIESLCLFYPRADEELVLEEVAKGLPIEASVAVRLVGRQHAREGSSYVLHRERTGLFALADGCVVTFLRFHALSQHELARTLYGDGEPPTCTARWNSDTGRLQPAKALPVRLSGRLSGEVHSAAGGGGVQRLKELVREAVGTGSLEPPGEYGSTNGVPLAGMFHFEGLKLGVCVSDKAICVVTPVLNSEAQAARDRALNKQRVEAEKAARAWERQGRGEQQAAEFLRKRGWTCEPPQSGGEGT